MPEITGQVLRDWRESRGWIVAETARRIIQAAHSAGLHVASLQSVERYLYRWEAGRPVDEHYQHLLVKTFGLRSREELAAGPYPAIAPQPPGPQEQRLGRHLADAAAASFTGTTDPASPAASVIARKTAARLAAWDAGPAPVPVLVLTAEQAGITEIEQLEATTDMFRVWDHQRGGALGRRAAIGQLADIAELLTCPHPEPLRRRLLAVAGRMSVIVGHMCADAGLDGHATRYFGLAVEAAREAGNGDLGARAVNAVGRRILDAGRPQDALTMLQYARSSLRGVRPSVTGLLYSTEAWAAAHLGDYDAMAPCLERAAELADGNGHVGQAEVAGVAGACYETLAIASQPTRRVKLAAQAAQHIESALELRDSYYVRSRVLDLAGLARVRLVQGEPGQAILEGTRALDAAVKLKSPRTARRIHALAITALTEYPAEKPVGEFAEQVRARLPVS